MTWRGRLPCSRRRGRCRRRRDTVHSYTCLAASIQNDVDGAVLQLEGRSRRPGVGGLPAVGALAAAAGAAAAAAEDAAAAAQRAPAAARLPPPLPHRVSMRKCCSVSMAKMSLCEHAENVPL